MSFKVSVVVPVYNTARFLSAAIESALKQKEANEIIIIDDGSTDNSWDIAKKIEVRESRVKLLCHESRQNLGPGPSRNLGIEHASNEFIAFLDADDCYLEDRFKHTKELFKDPKVMGVYEAVLDVNMKNGKIHLQYLIDSLGNNIEPDNLFEAILKTRDKQFLTSGTCFRKRALLEIKGFDDLRFMQDTLLYLKISYRYVFIGSNKLKPVAQRRIHSDNSIHKIQERQELKSVFSDKLHQFIDYRNATSTNYWLFIRIVIFKGARYSSRLQRYWIYLIKFLKLSMHYPLIMFNILSWRLSNSNSDKVT
jgi:glycosyltransferase involved in cell wall biosynthesis